jgi:hypothetical protein
MVHRSRIVGDGKEDAQNLAIRDLCWIKGDLNRFGVPSCASAYLFIGGSRLIAAGIAGPDLLDTLNMLKDTLDGPESAAGEDGDLHLPSCQRLIYRRRRRENRILAGTERCSLREGDQSEACETHEPNAFADTI